MITSRINILSYNVDFNCKDPDQDGKEFLITLEDVVKNDLNKVLEEEFVLKNPEQHVLIEELELDLGSISLDNIFWRSELKNELKEQIRTFLSDIQYKQGVQETLENVKVYSIVEHLFIVLNKYIEYAVFEPLETFLHPKEIVSDLFINQKEKLFEFIDRVINKNSYAFDRLLELLSENLIKEWLVFKGYSETQTRLTEKLIEKDHLLKNILVANKGNLSNAHFILLIYRKAIFSNKDIEFQKKPTTLLFTVVKQAVALSDSFWSIFFKEIKSWGTLDHLLNEFILHSFEGIWFQLITKKWNKVQQKSFLSWINETSGEQRKHVLKKLKQAINYYSTSHADKISFDHDKEIQQITFLTDELNLNKELEITEVTEVNKLSSLKHKFVFEWESWLLRTDYFPSKSTLQEIEHQWQDKLLQTDVKQYFIEKLSEKPQSLFKFWSAIDKTHKNTSFGFVEVFRKIILNQVKTILLEGSVKVVKQALTLFLINSKSTNNSILTLNEVEEFQKDIKNKIVENHYFINEEIPLWVFEELVIDQKNKSLFSASEIKPLVVRKINNAFSSFFNQKKLVSNTNIERVQTHLKDLLILLQKSVTEDNLELLLKEKQQLESFLKMTSQSIFEWLKFLSIVSKESWVIGKEYIGTGLSDFQLTSWQDYILIQINSFSNKKISKEIQASKSAVLVKEVITILNKIYPDLQLPESSSLEELLDFIVKIQLNETEEVEEKKNKRDQLINILESKIKLFENKDENFKIDINDKEVLIEKLKELEKSLEIEEEKREQTDLQRILDVEDLAIGSDNTDASQSEKIYLEGVGVVLLYPYISKLFKLYNLIDDKGKLKGKDNQNIAVQLLFYLVYGDKKMEEFLFPTFKLICGVPLQQPITTKSLLSEEQKKQCEGLISAVINHWKGIGKSSPETLRQQFLQRKGMYEQGEKTDLITVEELAFDMLIDSIPWGFRKMIFTWKKRIIEVKWR